MENSPFGLVEAVSPSRHPEGGANTYLARNSQQPMAIESIAATYCMQ
jgi:hypothetical protein